MKSFNNMMLIIPLLCLILFPFVIHEGLHIAGILSYGEEFTYGLNGLHLEVKCSSCDDINFMRSFVIAVLPYISAVIILLLSLIRKNRFIFWLGNIAYLDLVTNFLIFVFLFDGDFSIIYKTGFNIIGTALLIISTLLFYKINEENIKKLRIYKEKVMKIVGSS